MNLRLQKKHQCCQLKFKSKLMKYQVDKSLVIDSFHSQGFLIQVEVAHQYEHQLRMVVKDGVVRITDANLVH